jgi:hypothetical protein
MIRGCIVIMCAGLLVGCDANHDLEFFDKSAWREPVHCIAHQPLNESAVVADVVQVGDSAFAVLFSDDRELITYDRAFSKLHTLSFDAVGPQGVGHAVSAAVSDTMFYIADDANRVVKRFDRLGREQGIISLTFIPRRVRTSGERLLITPLVAGANPAHLLFTFEADKLRPLGAPIAQYDDIGINTMANMASLATFPKKAVLLHEMVVPFGYVVDFDRHRALTHRFAVPLSAIVRDRVGRLPKPPITEKNVNELTVVTFAAAANVAEGKTYYVTRIGDGRRLAYLKLLVELDTAMEVRAVYPIDANPHHMVFIDNPPAIVGVDAESNWVECKLP